MNEEQYTTSGFQSTSLPETIWGYTWAASTSLGNRSFASFMSITAVDNANNKGIYMAIDDQLYNQIADTDYRKKNFNATETTVGDFTYPAYSNVKFNTPTYEADEIYMRLSEAYLLKAEAEARSRVFIEATKRLERQIKEFAEAHRDDMDGKKTKTLNFGAVGFRKSTKIKLPKAPTKLAEIIQLLRSKGMDDCVKTPAPSVDKDALRKYPTQDIVAVGASIEVDDVFWYEPDREKLERG